MLTITIDGPAGAGKSTTADLVANHLNIKHLNTGAMYRAVAVLLSDLNIETTDADSINELINKMKLDVKFIGDVQHLIVNGIDVTDRLYENKISTLSSLYSTHYCIRHKLTNKTRQLSNNMEFVIDGRDSGSYVLPNAKYKFYLDCAPEERARRRVEELKSKGKEVNYEQILKEIINRDEFDKNKKIAPLVVPENAIIIDNSKLSIEQTAKLIIDKVENIKKMD